MVMSFMRITKTIVKESVAELKRVNLDRLTKSRQHSHKKMILLKLNEIIQVLSWIHKHTNRKREHKKENEKNVNSNFIE